MKDYEYRNLSSGKNNDSFYGVFGFVWEIVKVFLLALVIIMPIRIFLFQPFFVQGASMEPNFEDGEYLIINELGYKKTKIGVEGSDFFSIEPFKELVRGDVVVFRFPKNHEQFFIKRIVGLPGEKVSIGSGEVRVYNNQNPQGFLLEESYLPEDNNTKGNQSLELSENEYFVLGDNRSFSSDSRVWGPVDKDEIIGKVLLRAWPLDRAEIY